MEKRDIIVIVVAIIIVLIMAMYIKPLVTGKEAKLIPDEISNFLKNDSAVNGTDEKDEIQPSNSEAKNYLKPSITSISPNEINPNSHSKIEIEGKNLKDSMEILVFSDSQNKTIKTALEKEKLIGKNVSLSKGEWTVKIFDPELNITYNTQHVIHVVPTPSPEPTWDGKPKPLNVSSYLNDKDYYTGRSYPVDPIKKDVKFKTYSNFSGVRSVDTEALYIPYPFWDIIYTVEFQTEIANPQDEKLFEFNREYKEPLTLYEGEPIIYYEKGSSIPSIMSIKKEGSESKTEFRSSKDTVIAKTMQEEPDKYPPYEVAKESFRPSLVESVGYQKPVFKIIIKNEDLKNFSEIEITPPGGIDPLQWNEAKHKSEAEKMMIQKGLKKEFDSDEYQNKWEEKWKNLKDPRPWHERIYGAGNYSLQIFSQGIDSYNIKIEIPELEVIGTTQLPDNLSLTEIMKIKNNFVSFKDEYNNILYADNNLSSFYLLDNSNNDSFSTLIAEYKQNRAGGLVIEDIAINDVQIKGKYNRDGSLKQAHSAVVKGQIIIKRNDFEKIVPIDIYLQKFGPDWKFSTPIIFRF